MHLCEVQQEFQEIKSSLSIVKSKIFRIIRITMFNKRVYLIFFFLLTAFFGLCAQEALKSTEEEYYDFLALDGITERPTLNYRTFSDSVWAISEDAEGNVWAGNNLGTTKKITDHISYKIYGPDWFNSFNTAAPYGQNDGALWQGKGYNSSLTAGARLEVYGFEVTIKPQLSFSQNLDFDYMASNYNSEYGYFWGYGTNVGIDLPQRFGDSAFWTYDWGDTEIRYTWKTLTIGFGTQSPWLGPAWLNPMLGSNNAATYPKLDLGIRQTSLYMPWLGWYIGDVEARIWTGYMSESNYFDIDSSNDHNMLNALSFSYGPSFIPGLTLGLNRVFLTKWKWENLKYIGRLFTTARENDVSGAGEDQKASFTADWLFPKSGFEVYGEIGIDDFSSRRWDYPFHTMTYTVGMKKSLDPFPRKGIRGELIFEWNNMEMSQDFQFQWPYNVYFHHQITQGYTNQGQLLGTGYGPGGNAQYLGYKVFYVKGSTLFFLYRYNPDNDFIYSKTTKGSSTNTDPDVDSYRQFKTSFSRGITQEYWINANLLISGTFAYNPISRVEYYISDDSVTNFYFTLSGKYKF